MQTLEVIIGIVVYFLLLSLIATAIAEMVSSWRRSRGRFLREAVRLTCGGGESFCLAVYRHPLVECLYEADEPAVLTTKGGMGKVKDLLLPSKAERKSLPSYIPPDSFARAYLETLLGARLEEAGDLGALFADEARRWPEPAANAAPVTVDKKVEVEPRTESGSAGEPEPQAEGEAPAEPELPVEGAAQPEQATEAEGDQTTEDPELPVDEKTAAKSKAITPASRDAAYRALRPLVLEAKGNTEKTLKLVAEQFNRVNDRASGWYKRLIGRNLFLIGLVLAVCTNGDATRVFDRLNTDPALRQDMLELATSLAPRPAGGTNAPDAASRTNEPAGQGKVPQPAASEKEAREQILTRVRLAESVSGGWAHDPALNFESGQDLFLLWILKLVGFVITASAVSLGAPFWFDLLGKLVNVRNTVKGASAEGDASTAKSGPPRTEDEIANSMAAHNAGADPARFSPSPAQMKLEREMAWLADLAYSSEVEFKARLKEAGLDSATVAFLSGRGPLGDASDATTEILRAVDTQAYVLRTAVRLVVVFRGTEPSRPADIITDLRLHPTQVAWAGQEVLAHEGFLAALEAVWQPLAAKVDELNAEQPVPVHFCGHSLGGALAVLGGARYLGDAGVADDVRQRRASSFAGVHTIGQPRVGNAAFAKWAGLLFGGNYTRVVNNRDGVPRLPPETPGVLGYRHFGTLHFYDSQGRLWVDPSWFFRLLDFALPEKATQELAKEPVADHSATQYVSLYPQTGASASMTA